MKAVDRQLQRIAQVFKKDEAPEVNERTLKIYLKYLRHNFVKIIFDGETYKMQRLLGQYSSYHRLPRNIVAGRDFTFWKSFLSAVTKEA